MVDDDDIPPSAPGHEATVVRRVTSDSDPLIGAMLGEYRVLAPLGSGGVGLVYRGEQPVIGKPVAIKVLKREYAQDPQQVRRFLEEARAVSAARHPGIIDVFSFGETAAGEPYLVMELLEGSPLDVLLAERGRFEPRECIALLSPMLNALGAAHAAGVIHRDLKPGNVFVVELHDGTTFPKLLDFGLARRGEKGAAFVRQTSVGGTPLYIAPEQARGDVVGPYTDLYSLGCMAYELLVGKPPFTGVNLHELLDQHRTLAPKPLRAAVPEVPVELERLVLRLLEKDPSKRPASALDVREQLDRIGEAMAIAVVPTRVARPAQVAATTISLQAQPAKSSRGLIIGIAVAALTVTMGVAAFARSGAAVEVPRPPVEVVPEPEPEPEPVVIEKPEPTLTPLKKAPVVEVPTKKLVPVVVQHPRDVKRRWRELRMRTRGLPDDLRRAAELQLEEAKFCTGADQCWRELNDIEKTFFRK